MSDESSSRQEAYQQAQAFAARRRTRVGGRASLGRPLRLVVFLAIWLGGTLLTGLVLGLSGGLFAVLALLGPLNLPWLLLALWASRIPRVAAQWERAVVLRFGRFQALKGPGILFVFPVMDVVQWVDTRLQTMEIPHQQVITRDNVPVTIDGALFFLVRDPERAVITVQDYRSAINQYAQASLRDVVGSMTLDELLSEREEIQVRIAESVESRSQAWGMHVDAIRLLDINMPEDLKRMMSRQASAEREKRATITKAEGDRDAALNLAAAARTMAESPGAMQLRTLQTLDGLGPTPSNTVVLTVPVEWQELLNQIARKG